MSGNLERWVCALTLRVYKVKVKSLSHIWLFATPWTVAHQAPLSMGFSRQEYWSGLPFHKNWLGSLAKRRLCLGPAGVINCSPICIVLSEFVSRNVWLQQCSTMVLTVEKNPCVSTPTQVQTCVVEGSAVGKKRIFEFPSD